MFERDKEDLRALGIPLEVGTNDAWDDEPGYRIGRRSYELPDIALTPDEAAAVGLAARLWRSASLADATSRALLKLRAAGIAVDRSAGGAFEPRVDAAEPAFEPLLEATRAGASVTFDYRAAGAAEPHRRRVDPWSVVSWHGRWYVVGHDRDRDATRVFRLSRVTGPVRRAGGAAVPPPPDLDPRQVVARFEAPPTARRTALLRVRKGAGWSIRRGAAAVTDAGGEWDDVTYAYADVDELAEWLAGYAADVVVREPAELRDAVVRRLRAVAGEPSTVATAARR
jgi:proteasome accessory factor B